MRAVLFNPSHKPPTTGRLVDYVKRMSGVEVEVLEQKGSDPHWLRKPGPTNEAFRYVAKSVGEPFLWLEHDSIPLRPDWLERLEERWGKRKQGTLALMSTDRQTPHDLIGGIGIYDPVIVRDVPEYLTGMGFDTYLVQNHQPAIERTGLIQHSYGIYNHTGMAGGHLFPRDSWMLREDAAIFHADKTQSLITIYEHSH